MKELDDAQYREYADQVKRYLLCLTRDAALAEELTQETFYQAVKSIRRYNGQCKFSVWLCQIAKHLYLDACRKQARRQRRSAPSLDSLEQCAAPAHLQPEAVVERRDEAASVWDAIRQLPPPYGQVVLLRAQAGFSFREIGALLGKSEGWARVTFFRAKAKIMERMK